MIIVINIPVFSSNEYNTPKIKSPRFWHNFRRIHRD